MSQEGDWSRLMSENTAIDDIAILPIATQPNGPPQSASAPSARRRKPIRAANYSQNEDLQICKSWDSISSDPITGNEQPSRAYWKRIHEHFHANKDFASDRSENSIEHRWGTIHKECQKFQGLFEEVERRHPSGVPYQEHVRNVL